ncbi:MAG: NAD(P)/FAD-dependent oxidoreductase, partial [Gaiellaceae bacterium]
ADVVVVGAGICGAAAAFFLQERGHDVLLLERGKVSGGSTGLGEGNVLVSDKRPGPERELAVQGRELWLELGQRFPAARVTRKGALVLEHPDGDDAGDREPALAPGVRALWDEGDLQVDPAALTRALAAEVPTREGAEVAAAGDGAVVMSDGERIDCRHVVVATGAWAGELAGLPVEPRKGQLVALAAPPGFIRHKLFEFGYVEAAAGGSAELAVAAVIEQTLDGDEVLVGSSRERVGFDATVRDEVTQAMLQRAQRFVPGLSGLRVQRAWAGLRPWLPDGLPAIGRVADAVWTSTGHEGSGVGLGPISGLLLAEAISGAESRFDLSPFDPRRFGVRPPRRRRPRRRPWRSPPR